MFCIYGGAPNLDDGCVLQRVRGGYSSDRHAPREAGLEVRSEHTITSDWSLFGHSDGERRLDSSFIIVATHG